MKYQYLLILLLLIPLASAVNLHEGTVLNSTISNSSLTFSINVTASTVNVSDFAVNITNVVCSNVALTISEIYWDVPNANNDSASYCVLAAAGETCDNSTRTMYNLILICAAIGIVAIGGFFIYENGFDLTIGQVLFLGISLIVVITMFTTSAQLLGSACNLG